MGDWSLRVVQEPRGYQWVSIEEAALRPHSLAGEAVCKRQGKKAALWCISKVTYRNHKSGEAGSGPARAVYVLETPPGNGLGLAASPQFLAACPHVAWDVGERRPNLPVYRSTGYFTHRGHAMQFQISTLGDVGGVPDPVQKNLHVQNRRGSGKKDAPEVLLINGESFAEAKKTA